MFSINLPPLKVRRLLGGRGSMSHSLGYGLFHIDAVNARQEEDGQGRILKLVYQHLRLSNPRRISKGKGPF